MQTTVQINIPANKYWITTVTVYCEIIVHAKATWPSVRESDSKSVKGVPYAAPSSISVLVIPATLENELSKTLFPPGGTNRTIVTFKKNSPRNVKTNAVCLNRNVLCKLKWKTVKRMTGSGENNDQTGIRKV